MTSVDLNKRMAAVIAMLEEDLRTLRAGRASAELVNDLPVMAYGSQMTVKGVAAISTEGNQLILEVWDKSLSKAVEDAVRNSQLGFSVVSEGNRIRLSQPPLSGERRQEMVKLVHQKGEAARIELRRVRHDVLEDGEKQKKQGLMREDELNRMIKDADENIAKQNDKVKDLVVAKEKELLTV